MPTVLVAVVNSGHGQFIKVRGMPSNLSHYALTQLLYSLGFDATCLVFGDESIERITRGAVLYEWVRTMARPHLRRVEPTSCTLVAARADEGPTRLVYVQGLPTYTKSDDLIPFMCATGFGRHCIILKDPSDDAHCPIYEWSMSESEPGLHLVSPRS